MLPGLGNVPDDIRPSAGPKPHWSGNTAIPEGMADDLVVGAKAIAEFLYGDGSNAASRRVYHLLQREALPFFKLGGSLAVRKSAVADWIAKQIGFVPKIETPSEIAKVQERLVKSGKALPGGTNTTRAFLAHYLESNGIDRERWAEIIQAIELLVARMGRPKWDDRYRFPELARLSAPAFLKKVHSSEIDTQGAIHKETIREIDAALMNAVESYISTRTRRHQDLGEARDMRFHTSRPARAKAPRSKSTGDPV